MALPLEGVRVLDLSRLLPGGFCSLLLADFGAEVIKVEDTRHGRLRALVAALLRGRRGQREGRAVPRAQPQQELGADQPQGAEPGATCCCGWSQGADVVLESFRPGVLDRLGVGYEAMRAVNPRIVYCAITGYGQDGPMRDRSGHDMNYLGLIGLLGLTGEADGPPVQAAGQIADLGGGALMAAFGILAALRERDRSGEGQFVDVSMADGALSWLAMVAGQYLCDGVVPRRGAQLLAGGIICYRPYRCADGCVTLGALEPKFWRNWCAGVGREDLIERQFEAPGRRRAPRGRSGLRRAHARRVGGIRRRARLLPGARARPRRGARRRARARRARWSSSSTSPAPRRRCGCSARR